MKILVTGANGQLGNKIIQQLGATHQLILTDSDNMDITNAEKVAEVAKAENPAFMLHCAAYTKVDQAEDQADLAHKINVIGTENLAKVAAKLSIPILYISTDFVFDGKEKKPYSEEDSAKPLSVYGRTKLDGENIIRNLCHKYYIVRVAWLFGELPAGHSGSNFVETMIRLAGERDSLSVVDDQIGSATYTGDLVRFIEFIIGSTSHAQPRTTAIPYGTYHLSGEGETSWYGFAQEIFRQTNIDIDLEPIKSSEYPAKAKRPAYSYLSKEKAKKIGFPIRSWQEMLAEYLVNRSK